MDGEIQPIAASPFEALRREDQTGEFWSARDLQSPLGYDRWERFVDAIDRAQAACNNSGQAAPDHFRGAAKMVTIGSGAVRDVADYRLTRYAAYLVAMNGDPRKPEIAEAQTYFAVKTREAEIAAPMSGEELLARAVLEATSKIAEIESARAAAVQRNVELSGAVAELTPKAKTFDVFLSTAGDYSVNEAAKTLSRDHSILTGEKRLFGFMEQIGWTYRDAKGKPVPYQAQVDNGRLAAKPRFHYHPETGEPVADAPQVRVTAKGLQALRHKLLRDAS